MRHHVHVHCSQGAAVALPAPRASKHFCPSPGSGTNIESKKAPFTEGPGRAQCHHCALRKGGHFIWHFKNRGVSRAEEAGEGTETGRKRPLGTDALGKGKRGTGVRVGAKPSGRGPLQMAEGGSGLERTGLLTLALHLCPIPTGSLPSVILFPSIVFSPILMSLGHVSSDLTMPCPLGLGPGSCLPISLSLDR